MRHSCSSDRKINRPLAQSAKPIRPHSRSLVLTPSRGLGFFTAAPRVINTSSLCLFGAFQQRKRFDEAHLSHSPPILLILMASRTADVAYTV